MDGQTAPLDPRFRDRSFGERVLMEIIPHCWKLNPDERIDIFELTDWLRRAVAEDQRLVSSERHNLRR